jgi:hypothetical protein
VAGLIGDVVGLAATLRPGCGVVCTVFGPSALRLLGAVAAVVAIVVTVFALLTVLWPAMNRRLHVVAVWTGALIVLAVGFGRVALNVHHPSDVLAGWALGYLYFAACARVFGISRVGYPRRHPDHQSLLLNRS